MIFENTRGRGDFYEIIFIKNPGIHPNGSLPCRKEQDIACPSPPITVPGSRARHCWGGESDWTDQKIRK
jgi:hypothetical protein